jgi:hypothetical protein
MDIVTCPGLNRSGFFYVVFQDSVNPQNFIDLWIKSIKKALGLQFRNAFFERLLYE